MLLFHPRPSFPIPLGIEGFYLDGADDLDGRGCVPFRKSSLRAGINHAVQHRIQEVLAQRGAGFLFSSWENGVDKGDKPDISVDEIGKPQSTEFLGADLDATALSALSKLHHPLQAAEVDLFDHLGFTANAGDLPDIVVGSSLLHFFM